MSEPCIFSERQNHILIITINRPQAKNSFNAAAAQEMSRIIDQFENDSSLFLAIVTGAGGTFCAGADLRAVSQGESASTPERGGFGIFKKPPCKPLIAAVEGYAVGGGMELCMACDMVVAASDAKFGLPEVRHNVVALGGGLFRTAKRIPYNIAMQFLLTGDMQSATALQQWGFVNIVTEPGEALAGALALAHRILRNGPTALAATKQVVRASIDWSEETSWELQNPIVRPALESEDRREGISAFLEKRTPVWKGR